MVSTTASDATNGKSLRIEPPPRHVHYNPEFVCVSSEAVLQGSSSKQRQPRVADAFPLVIYFTLSYSVRSAICADEIRIAVGS